MSTVVNDLLLAVDGGCPSVLLSLDISAAFDTLNHRRLLDSAEELFGVTDGLARAWLCSYLSGRSQCVSLAGQQYATKLFDSGVQQGSVLGPLLFCIFTTPIGSVISDFTTAWWLSVGRWTCDWQVAGSIPGRSAFAKHRLTQPRIRPRTLNRVPASTGGKGGILTSAGWHATLCDPICEYPVAVRLTVVVANSYRATLFTLLTYHQYADDLQLYTSIRTTSTSNGLHVLSECANAVTRWHLENGLLLLEFGTVCLLTLLPVLTIAQT